MTIDAGNYHDAIVTSTLQSHVMSLKNNVDSVQGNTAPKYVTLKYFAWSAAHQ